MFENDKNIKGPEGFKLMNYRFMAIAETHYVTLICNNFGGKQLYAVILDFIVYLNWKYVTTWKCPIPP